MTPPDSGAHTKKVGLTERVRFNKHSARHSNNLSNTLQNHLESLFECSSSSGSRVAAGKPSSNRGTRTLLYGQVESVEQGCHAVVRTDRQVESVEEVCFLHRHTRVPGLTDMMLDIRHLATVDANGVVPVSVPLLLVAATPLLCFAFVAHRLQLGGLESHLLVGLVRCFAQLMVLGSILTPIFTEGLDRPWLVFLCESFKL